MSRFLGSLHLGNNHASDGMTEILKQATRLIRLEGGTGSRIGLILQQLVSNLYKTV